MKNLQKLLSLVLAGSVLLLAACSKKPVRDPNAGTAMGQDNTVNPDQVALPSDVAPGTALEARNLPPGATEDEFTIRGLMEAVYFDFDRSAVRPSERPKVEAAVKWLKENADKRMLLEGHCDWRGTAEYNLGLGDRRAAAVKKYLEFLGVDGKRLEILSKGSVDAKQTGGDAEWAKDRRVDFVVLKK
ncbi:MAG: flagellar motor protein MotB [Opitutus sp.]|nr:flagellar motor protein MotB [Opitutus sp.]